MVKNPHANSGDIRDVGSIPGLGRSPEGGHGNLLQYPCLENPMDREEWQAIVHEVMESQTGLEQLSMHTYTHTHTHTHTHIYIYIHTYICVSVYESENVSHSVVSDSL